RVRALGAQDLLLRAVAEVPVTVGGPADERAEIAVEVVDGARGEGDGRARVDARVVGRRGDGQRRPGIRAAHADRDRRLADLVVGGGDRGGDPGGADAERAGADGGPGAYRALEVGRPLQPVGDVAVLEV